MGQRAITADTVVRLCRYFGQVDGYWLRAQATYDTEVAQEALAEAIVKISRGNRQKLLTVLAKSPDVEPEAVDSLPTLGSGTASVSKKAS